MFFVRKRKPKLRVFFSHSNKDARIVRKLARKIARRGGSPWAYEYDEPGHSGDESLRFGDKISPHVHKAIDECDFFIIIASQAGLSSNWVARETWLAEYFLKQRGNHNPRVIAYVPSRVSGRVETNMQLPLRDFETGELSGEVRDLSAARAFAPDNAHTDRFDDLYKLLQPSVKIFGRDYEDGEELQASGVFETYVKLFSDPLQRDDPDDILEWLVDSPGYVQPRVMARITSLLTAKNHNRLGENEHAVWGDLLSTFDVAGRAVGLLYVSIHKRTGWVFGNYFGLLRSWRPHQRAKWFFDETVNHLRRTVPNMKGIVFEVDPFEPEAVRRLKHKLEKAPTASEMTPNARSSFLDNDEEKLIKAIRRVVLYTRNGARIVLGKNDRPLWYRQPAMEVPGPNQSLEALESPLWLTVYPIAKSRKHADLRELLDVVYLELFGKAYAPIFAEKGIDYMPYVQERRDRSFADANPGPIVTGRVYSKDDAAVVRLAEDKGFNVDL